MNEGNAEQLALEDALARLKQAIRNRLFQKLNVRTTNRQAAAPVVGKLDVAVAAGIERDRRSLRNRFIQVARYLRLRRRALFRKSV